MTEQKKNKTVDSNQLPEPVLVTDSEHDVSNKKTDATLISEGMESGGVETDNGSAKDNQKKKKKQKIKDESSKASLNASETADTSASNQKQSRTDISPTPTTQSETKTDVESELLEPNMNTKPSKDNTSHAISPVVIKQSGGKGIALGALVLSLLALGASGFLYVEGQNALANANRDIKQKIDLASFGSSKDALNLQQALTEQKNQEKVLSELQNTVSAIQDQSQNVTKAYQDLSAGRMTWLVNEVEYVLNITAQQLMFSGNTQAARWVLQGLEKKLNRFDRPELLSIKAAISEDLTQIQAASYIDVVSTSLRLDRLISDSKTLPLLLESSLKSNVPTQQMPVPTQKEGKWYENLWEDTKMGLASLVQVRKISKPDAMLLAPDQSYFIQQNIKLKLLDAKLALLQQQAEIYQSDLSDVRNEVVQYYDASSPIVGAWIAELDRLALLDLKVANADLLSHSLQAVKDYQEQHALSLNAPIPNTPATESSEPNAKTEAEAPTDGTQAAPSTAPSTPAVPPASDVAPKTEEAIQEGGA